jgi:dipeptidyl aminopeptidase/acylaminoacyl peptidase
MTSPLIPLEVLFGGGSAQQPQLSPSGGRLAYRAPGTAGMPAIWVADAAQAVPRGAAPAAVGMPRATAVTGQPGGIGAFRWTGDDRYLVYAADRDGDEQTHIRLVDIAAGTDRDLTPYPGVAARLAGADPGTPGAILIGLDRHVPGIHDLYRAELPSGELTLAAHNPGVVGWLADRRLRVLGALAPRPGGGLAVLVRDTEAAPWRTLYEIDQPDTGTFRAFGFTTAADAIMLASSRGADAARLVRVDVATGAETVMYQDPEGYDVTEAQLDPATGQPRIAVVQRQRRDLEAVDPALAGELSWLRQRCRGDVGLLGHDRTDRWWLIQDLADDAPAAYLLLDRRNQQLRYLYSHWPALGGYQLGRMEPFSLTARDGLTLHGYLTYPPGEGRRGLPTVLLVHGGPWDRDLWGLRAENQWLASRGYLCVQVNFRGSTGYGKDFTNAGDREWGGRMQDDLTDTIRYLVTRRVADPGRLAVMGHSYGGYAALCAAAFTPGLVRCAIASAAPADLRSFVESIPPSWRLAADELHRRVGDPAADADFLWSRSPLSRVADIRIPVLIAHGANDPRVRRDQAEQIVSALAQRGLPHEFLLFEDEGHGFSRPRNKITFYAAAERFLAEHVPAGAARR